MFSDDEAHPFDAALRPFDEAHWRTEGHGVAAEVRCHSTGRSVRVTVHGYELLAIGHDVSPGEAFGSTDLGKSLCPGVVSSPWTRTSDGRWLPDFQLPDGQVKPSISHAALAPSKARGLLDEIVADHGFVIDPRARRMVDLIALERRLDEDERAFRRRRQEEELAKHLERLEKQQPAAPARARVEPEAEEECASFLTKDVTRVMVAYLLKGKDISMTWEQERTFCRDMRDFWQAVNDNYKPVAYPYAPHSIDLDEETMRLLRRFTTEEVAMPLSMMTGWMEPLGYSNVLRLVERYMQLPDEAFVMNSGDGRLRRASEWVRDEPVRADDVPRGLDSNFARALGSRLVESFDDDALAHRARCCVAKIVNEAMGRPRELADVRNNATLALEERLAVKVGTEDFSKVLFDYVALLPEGRVNQAAIQAVLDAFEAHWPKPKAEHTSEETEVKPEDLTPYFVETVAGRKGFRDGGRLALRVRRWLRAIVIVASHHGGGPFAVGPRAILPRPDPMDPVVAKALNAEDLGSVLDEYVERDWINAAARQAVLDAFEAHWPKPKGRPSNAEPVMSMNDLVSVSGCQLARDANFELMLRALGEVVPDVLPSVAKEQMRRLWSVIWIASEQRGSEPPPPEQVPTPHLEPCLSHVNHVDIADALLTRAESYAWSHIDLTTERRDRIRDLAKRYWP